MNARWASVAGASDEISRLSLAGTWLAYTSAFDRQSYQEAAYYLERCLINASLTDPSLGKLFFMEAGILHAWDRGDVEKATVWFKRAGMETMPEILQVRYLAALECAKGNFDGALLLLEEGFQAIARFPEGASRDRWQEGWAEWKERMLNRRRQSLSVTATPAQS
jgi:hypothetical protein